MPVSRDLCGCLVALQSRVQVIRIDCQRSRKTRAPRLCVQMNQGQYPAVGEKRNSVQKLLIRLYDIAPAGSTSSNPSRVKGLLKVTVFLLVRTVIGFFLICGTSAHLKGDGGGACALHPGCYDFCPGVSLAGALSGCVADCLGAGASFDLSSGLSLFGLPCAEEKLLKDIRLPSNVAAVICRSYLYGIHINNFQYF